MDTQEPENVIFAYTDAQALEDSVLVEVGFLPANRVTRSVFDRFTYKESKCMPNGNSHRATLSEAQPSFEPLLDLAEAAGLLRIHPQTLKKMAIRRDVPAIKVGRLWRFRASDLQEWINARVSLVQNDSERRASERRQ